MAGMLVVATTGFLMVSETIEFRQSLSPVMIGMGLIGVWMAITGYNGLDFADFPELLPWLAIVIGIALAVAMPAGLFWSDDLGNRNTLRI